MNQRFTKMLGSVGCPFALAGLFVLSCLVTVTPVAAQSGVARGQITAPRDPELEKQSLSSLNTARFYFFKRKPEKNDKEAQARSTKAILDRLNEIIDTNPNFARMDSVIFLMGEVYQRDNQLDKAREHWSVITKEYPDSEHYQDAKKRLGTTVEIERNPKEIRESKPEKKG